MGRPVVIAGPRLTLTGDVFTMTRMTAASHSLRSEKTSIKFSNATARTGKRTGGAAKCNQSEKRQVSITLWFLQDVLALDTVLGVRGFTATPQFGGSVVTRFNVTRIAAAIMLVGALHGIAEAGRRCGGSYYHVVAAPAYNAPAVASPAPGQGRVGYQSTYQPGDAEGAPAPAYVSPVPATRYYAPQRYSTPDRNSIEGWRRSVGKPF